MSKTPSGPDDDQSAQALDDVARLPDITAILEVCARVTGMGYVVVAHVTEDRWLACAVLDEIEFGLPVGGELPIRSTLCHEVRTGRASIAFDNASADPAWKDHHTPQTYGLESYIAAPIILGSGEFFGTLCAVDSRPAPASRPATVRMFELFAKLIASQIDVGRKLAVSEAALSVAQDTAELREQFIAVLGHDLRNPLAAVHAGVAMLGRGASERDLRVLSEMRKSIGRMERLIGDVLDFAKGRLGGGIAVTRRDAVDLSTPLVSVVEELRAAHAGRVIETAFDIRQRVPADPDRMSQLLSNLVSNALTHGDPDHPVEITGAVEGGAFRLMVANGGAPIPEAIRPRLFQPFNRRDSDRVREGLGLGLYIASEIARAHGGELTVASDDARTRFVFTMPL